MTLVYIFGLFNTGKTTLAQALGRELGYDVMSADAVRTWLGCPPGSSSDTLVLSAMSDSIEWHRAQDRDLIVESEGTWPRVKHLLTAGAYEDITRVVLLLEATEQVREQRDAARTERLRTLGWGIRAPLDASVFAPGHHRIDTTSATQGEVQAIASKIIRHATADATSAVRAPRHGSLSGYNAKAIKAMTVAQAKAIPQDVLGALPPLAQAAIRAKVLKSPAE
jgi:hypothetical protein